VTDASEVHGVPAPAGGRNRREPGGRKHEAKVRMNDEEFARVQARALAMGVSIPRVLIESATGAPALTRTERSAYFTELMAMRRLLANLTNNVNQIARVLNSQGDVADREIRAALDRSAAATQRIEELAEVYRP
jgi:hypothetical protein